MRTKNEEDLTFLYAELSKHPLLLLDQKKRTQFDELYDQELARFYTVVPAGQNKTEAPAELIDAMTRLTMFFRDGHTNIALPYTPQDKCLYIPCDWQDDRLLLLQDYEDILAGSQIPRKCIAKFPNTRSAAREPLPSL